MLSRLVTNGVRCSGAVGDLHCKDTDVWFPTCEKPVSGEWYLLPEELAHCLFCTVRSCHKLPTSILRGPEKGGPTARQMPFGQNLPLKARSLRKWTAVPEPDCSLHSPACSKGDQRGSKE